ncbi:MAG TPA: hypothetical protein VGY56_20355 [Verrucomicrobiae bacterium]|nr:hypothetical protein [Verrucomicrobiae bacterium]
MSALDTNLKSFAVRELKSVGLSWATLSRQAKQIIVFGSHALAANTGRSDLDLLCIGEGRNFKSSRVHLIWIPEKNLRSRRWLGSELATHVAMYGIWIKGDNSWAFQTKPNLAALARKRKNIIRRLKAMDQYWDNLLPLFRCNQILKLRRDLQRYQMMQKGHAPLPKTMLDDEWQRYPEARAWRHLLEERTSLHGNLANFLANRRIVSSGGSD